MSREALSLVPCTLATEVGEAASCWCRAVCLYLTRSTCRRRPVASKHMIKFMISSLEPLLILTQRSTIQPNSDFSTARHHVISGAGGSAAADTAYRAASSGDYSPTGVTASSDATAGESPARVTSSGESPTGDTSSGEPPTGDTSSGEPSAGYTSSGEPPAGDSSTSYPFTASTKADADAADPNTGDAIPTSAGEFYDPHRPPSQQQSHGLSPSQSSTPPLLPPHSFVSSGGASDHSALPGMMQHGAFGYDELAAAADGFSESNLLGQGGFGQVYKGTIRGQEVAIKKLRSGSGQGEREFQAEVEIISRVHHKNLVSLVGYCIYGEQRLLVYEYVPNKTLEFHLHGSGRPALDWPRRWKIAVGSAKGLAYLHEDCHPKIIHRDIKAANILLDYTFEPKVADFGLAKYQAAEQTAVSTRVMGTFGYLAPEYAATGKVNDRSDVFSFGVMLLELITGKKPIMMAQGDQPDTLVSWARPLLARAMEEENFEELIDPKLENNYDAYDMARLIACAAAAVRQTARSRPRMSQIVRYLEGELAAEDLNAGVTPGQSAMQRTGGGTTDQIKRLKKLAFGSGTGTTGTVSEYTSSEFSEPTSEYGLNPSSEYTTSAAGGDTGEVTVDMQRMSGASGEVATTQILQPCRLHLHKTMQTMQYDLKSTVVVETNV
uniref:non-specific serine/threonine protein kinase n=1 Tax=Leersia perrieri TaxID=77586 RepID=A0A0D9V5P0_9ORYZ